MECPLGKALQGTQPILAKAGSRHLLSHAGFAGAGACRGLDGEAVSGSAREVPAGAGPAGQFAAFLGRMV